MLSPDGYTILPIRPVTTTRTVAIFMVLQLDRNLHIVNAPPFSEARSSVGYWSAGRTSQSWVERFESASTAEQREPVVRSRSPIGAIGVEIAPRRSRRDGRAQRPHQQTHDAFIAARDMVECRAASGGEVLGRATADREAGGNIHR